MSGYHVAKKRNFSLVFHSQKSGWKEKCSMALQASVMEVSPSESQLRLYRCASVIDPLQGGREEKTERVHGRLKYRSLFESLS